MGEQVLRDSGAPERVVLVSLERCSSYGVDGNGRVDVNAPHSAYAIVLVETAYAVGIGRSNQIAIPVVIERQDAAVRERETPSEIEGVKLLLRDASECVCHATQVPVRIVAELGRHLAGYVARPQPGIRQPGGVLHAAAVDVVLQSFGISQRIHAATHVVSAVVKLSGHVAEAVRERADTIQLVEGPLGHEEVLAKERAIG